MNTSENTIAVRLSREEIKVLLKALAAAPTGQADTLLWQLAEMQQEFNAPALPSLVITNDFLRTAA